MRPGQQLYNDRVRRVSKTIAWAAGTQDQITVVGPTTHVIIDFHHTTAGGFTLQPSGGTPNAWTRIMAQTNRRGTIWDVSGIELEGINAMWFNGDRSSQTAGVIATETQGGAWVVPLTLDPGEMCTLNFTAGALADVGAAVTGIAGTLRVSVIIAQPKTYWAFRAQVAGVNGALANATPFTQPQIPIIPGFALCGGGFNIGATDAVTIVTNLIFPLRSTLLLSQGDDYLIDADFAALRAVMCARASSGTYLEAGTQAVARYGIPWHMCSWRHTPVANNDSTTLTWYNGTGLATFGPRLTRFCYYYISGAITPDMAITPPATKEVGGGVTLQNPARQLSPSQSIGPSVIPAGTAGGTSLFNLRGSRR